MHAWNEYHNHYTYNTLNWVITNASKVTNGIHFSNPYSMIWPITNGPCKVMKFCRSVTLNDKSFLKRVIHFDQISMNRLLKAFRCDVTDHHGFIKLGTVNRRNEIPIWCMMYNQSTVRDVIPTGGIKFTHRHRHRHRHVKSDLFIFRLYAKGIYYSYSI